MTTLYLSEYLCTQLESVAKISNLHYIEAFQCIGNPIHWNASIYWVTNTLKCFNILGYQYIEMLQYIANYLFLQRTLTVQWEQALSLFLRINLIFFSSFFFQKWGKLFSFAPNIWIWSRKKDFSKMMFRSLYDPFLNI